MKVLSIVRPSGGVRRWTPDATGGCSRSVSLMIPLRWSRFWRSWRSKVPSLFVRISASSSRNFRMYSGCDASSYAAYVNAADVVSLKFYQFYAFLLVRMWELACQQWLSSASRHSAIAALLPDLPGHFFHKLLLARIRRPGSLIACPSKKLVSISWVSVQHHLLKKTKRKMRKQRSHLYPQHHLFVAPLYEPFNATDTSWKTL